MLEPEERLTEPEIVVFHQAIEERSRVGLTSGPDERLTLSILAKGIVSVLRAYESGTNDDIYWELAAVDRYCELIPTGLSQEAIDRLISGRTKPN